MPDSDLYRELFLRSADAITILKRDTFIGCNPAAVEMFRATDRSEMLSLHPSDLSPPLQPDGANSYEKANEMIAIAIEQGSNRFEWDHRRLDGEVFAAEVLLTAIDDPGREVLHAVIRDVTERKQLERQLQHAQKMEAIGKLAGGIAHDFNNLLVIMLGSCDLLLAEEHDEEVVEHIEQIRAAGQRGAELVHELLAFSRNDEPRNEPLYLGEVAEQLLVMLQRLVSEDIHLTLRHDADTTILATRTRIEQVLLNLVSNAQDAMEDGGLLEIEVTTGHHPATGKAVILSVRDEGTGMSTDTARKAFEPFFTTKGLGAGTGLGLSTVYSIVEQAGGHIELDSTLGEGTTATVWFPQADAPVVVEEPSVELDGRGQGELILLVEDDSAIRKMLALLLENSGFRVVSAADGLEGMEVAEAHRGQMALILTDVVMPNMGGADMMLELRARGFETPVVFSSGYTDSELKKLDELNEPLDLIEKPFDLRTLVKRVQGALTRGNS